MHSAVNRVPPAAPGDDKQLPLRIPHCQHIAIQRQAHPDVRRIQVQVFRRNRAAVVLRQIAFVAQVRRLLAQLLRNLWFIHNSIRFVLHQHFVEVRIQHAAHVLRKAVCDQNGVRRRMHDAELPVHAVRSERPVPALPNLVAVALRPVAVRVVAVANLPPRRLADVPFRHKLLPLPAPGLHQQNAELCDVLRVQGKAEAARADAVRIANPPRSGDAHRRKQFLAQVLFKVDAALFEGGRQHIRRARIVTESFTGCIHERLAQERRNRVIPRIFLMERLTSLPR